MSAPPQPEIVWHSNFDRQNLSLRLVVHIDLAYQKRHEEYCMQHAPENLSIAHMQ